MALSVGLLLGRSRVGSSLEESLMGSDHTTSDTISVSVHNLSGTVNGKKD